MNIEWAEWLVRTVGLYLGLGVVFAIVFIAVGVWCIDTGAKGMPWVARLLILPGLIALWPLMLQKFLTQKEPPIA